jgi:glycosyl hydrolase family 71
MGESGKHKAYGGFVRDRPLGRDPLSGNYEAKDLQTEIEQAISAGVDGFTIDILSISSSNWTRTINMLDAAQAVDPKFKIMAMPDMTMLDDETPDNLAKAIKKFDSYPSAFHLSDGRLVVSPFKTENHSASWWKSWLSLLKNTYGVDVAFVPTFLDWQKYADDYASFTYGVSHWGVANTDAAANTAKHAKLAHDMGKIWMAPVRVQDVRPNQSIYDEADNSRTLRLSWQGVIDGDADWVQLATWNDYTEGSQIAPSAHHGWTYLDISSYYIDAWKTGSKPTIKRDGLYVVHRTQSYSAKPSFPQTKLVSLRSGTPSPVNQVEVVSFLKSAGTVTVKVGSNTYTWDAPAGMAAKDFPLSSGTVSASVERGGDVTTSVTSPYKITGSPYVQDLEYAAAGSLR